MWVSSDEGNKSETSFVDDVAPGKLRSGKLSTTSSARIRAEAESDEALKAKHALEEKEQLELETELAAHTANFK